MSIDLLNDLSSADIEAILFTSVILIALLGIVARFFFPKAFFKIGIPVYWDKLAFTNRNSDQTFETIHFDQIQFEKTGTLNALPEITVFSATEAAIYQKIPPRKHIFQSRINNPATTGALLLDDQNQQIRLIIKLKPFTLIFVPFWFWAVSQAPFPINLLFGLGGIFVIYMIFRNEQALYVNTLVSVFQYLDNQSK